MNDLYQIRITKEMGRGVFAKKDIEVGTKLLQLQPRNYLNYGIVAEHEFFGRLWQFYQTNKKEHFAFYMAFVQQHKKHEKKHSLAVVKYIENLPKIFNSLICWNEDDLKMLEDKELVQRAREKRTKIEESFMKVKKYLMQNSEVFFIPNYQENYSRREEFVDSEQKSQEYINESEQTEPDQQQPIEFNQYRNLCANVTFEQFLRFYTAIVTRHVYYTNGYDSNSQMGALIPVLQLFNHCPNGQVKDEISFLKTIKHIHKDQQIFVSYGELSNDKLLLEYGFVIDKEFYQIKNDYEAVLSAKICENRWKGVVIELSNEITKQFSQSKEVELKISQERAKLSFRYNKIFKKEISPLAGDN